MNLDPSALEQSLGLPLIVPLETVGARVNVYGIAEIARDYCGLDYVPRLIPGFWMHGWQADFYHLDPEVICPLPPERGAERKWVCRQTEADYLNSHGYPNTRAIGHPVTYLPAESVPRRPGSLLVMPCRSFRGHRRDIDCDYADAIAGLRDQFQEIVICISPQSLEEGDWVDSFEKLGFPIIRGASINDRNGFRRLARLMSQFEFVTTNGVGSQIVYGAYFGAKVSVWGPEPIVPPPEKPGRLFRAHPELREELFRLQSVTTLLQHEPWLGVEPALAPESLAWARRALGEEHRLTPGELRYEFGWEVEQLREFNIELEQMLLVEKELLREEAQVLKRIEQLEEELRASSEAHAAKLAAQDALIEQTTAQVAELKPRLEHWAWKYLGRPLYSLEKRLSRNA